MSPPGELPPAEVERDNPLRGSASTASWIKMPRILLLGMGEAGHGDDGIGVPLAHALGEAIEALEAKEAPSNEMDYLELFREFDRILVVDAVCVPGEVGRVFLVSPLALLSLKRYPGPQEVAFDHALESARIYGRSVPIIEVIGICISDSDQPSTEMSAELRDAYKSVLARVRAIVVSIVRDARMPATGRGGAP